MALPLLLLLTSLGSPARAGPGDEEVPRISLRVGQSTELALVTVQVRCDDPQVVRVEAQDKVLRLTGLKAGETLCGFWQSSAFRRLYRIVVREK